MTSRRVATTAPGAAVDVALDLRLERSRRGVAGQREALRCLRRRLRETHAAASAVTDRATAVRLRLQPPVPSYPPHDA